MRHDQGGTEMYEWTVGKRGKGGGGMKAYGVGGEMHQVKHK